MTRARWVGWAFAAAAVGAQVAYPQVHGIARQRLSVVVVVLFALAVLIHAGRHALPLLVFAGGGGLLVEAWGVASGLPFGQYAYTGHLGPRLLDVPLVVPLAWSMMAWPALCAARRLSPVRGVRIVVAAVALASWDLLLDPQMVAAGNWRWRPDSAALQGVPLRNDVGWLLCALVLMGVLERVCGPAPDTRLPISLWLWTWLGSVTADVAFLDLHKTALVGGVAMGVVGVPLLRGIAPGISATGLATPQAA